MWACGNAEDVFRTTGDLQMLTNGSANSARDLSGVSAIVSRPLFRQQTVWRFPCDDVDRVSLSRRLILRGAQRIVIKIGSSVIVDNETGQVRQSWLNALVQDVSSCRARGQEVLIVSSGAVAVGRHHLSFPHRQLRLEQKQAAASAGQVILTQAFRNAFEARGIGIGQILLTSDDTEARERHLNARSTLNQLLALGAVPIINENDATTSDGIRFGDNDRLAARVSQMLQANALLLLSDVDGLYTADPRRDAGAQLLTEVTEITPEIRAMAGDARNQFSSGGMLTKLIAAQIAMNAGCHTIIANGEKPRPLTRIAQGTKATWFKPHLEPQTGRKAWIAGALKTAGALTVDSGAVKALYKGKSLLPVGVVAVNGRFGCGDMIAICDRGGAEIARGIAAYSSSEAELIAGHRSYVFERLLGFRGPAEIIHRDNLVLHGSRLWDAAKTRPRPLPQNTRSQT